MNKIKQYFEKNKGNIKGLLLSFAIAICAWFFVSMQIFPTIEETIKNIGIEIQPTEYMQQNNLEIISKPSEVADIRIEGKRYDITGLSGEDFYAVPDLSSIKSAGTFTVPLNVSPKNNTECVIIEKNPLTITIKVDEIVTREFELVATAPAISLPEGYYVDEMIANPATISITGSASMLDKISYIEARSSYNGAISESHETQSELFIYGANGARIVSDELKLSTNSVSVHIPIYKLKKLPLKFSFTNVPSNFDLSSLSYEIQPPAITVAAPDDSIDYISELDIGTVDMSDIKLNNPAYLLITLPEGYKNLSGNSSARIVWNISDYGKLDFSVTNINIKNAPDNFEVTPITNELVITVMGPSEEISELTAADFFITADVLGKIQHEGSQDVPVTIHTKGNKQNFWVSGSYKITVYAEPIAQEASEE